MMLDYFLFGLGVILSAFGGIFLKLAGQSTDTASLQIWIKTALQNRYLLIGFSLYIFPAFIWIYLLKKFPLSFVQPIIALTYVLTPILAYFLLKEDIPLLRWVGIITIVIGIIIVAKS